MVGKSVRASSTLYWTIAETSMKPMTDSFTSLKWADRQMLSYKSFCKRAIVKQGLSRQSQRWSNTSMLHICRWVLLRLLQSWSLLIRGRQTSLAFRLWMSRKWRRDQILRPSISIKLAFCNSWPVVNSRQRSDQFRATLSTRIPTLSAERSLMRLTLSTGCSCKLSLPPIKSVTNNLSKSKGRESARCVIYAIR